MTKTNYLLVEIKSRKRYPVYLSDGRMYIKYKKRNYHVDKLIGYGFKLIKK